MGCPGQARTKPRSNQPSQRCRRRRRTAAAANITCGSSRTSPHQARRTAARNLVRLAATVRLQHAPALDGSRNHLRKAAGQPATHGRPSHGAAPQFSGRDARQARIQSRAPMRAGEEGGAAAHGGGLRPYKNFFLFSIDSKS
ncbi:myosin-binding protein 1-like [Dorcoceras hygrometricum]|uniref:Myosin-binding protein 1-like n=1 Tax=Dorcoceras hygrometricum TaxID=472368 RepID=A0A2Z7D7N4_9LAMI|nr:myosin-binding protein 1-like [Dorcoceras hygrometricum]